jgi:TolB-like protein/DNA-binding winged helix-turn-helix (wHTH) protein/tetratricopeptide (TPR) repeat protein
MFAKKNLKKILIDVMGKKTQHLYEFGEFRLNTAERLLLRFEEVVPLKAKVFDMLVLLLDNAGHLLEKEWLMQQLWPDSFVEEVNLNVNISALRKALGERVTKPIYIETVSKRGYRFITEVKKTPIVDDVSTVVLPKADENLSLVEEKQALSTESSLRYITQPLPDLKEVLADKSETNLQPAEAEESVKLNPLFNRRFAASAVILLLVSSASAYFLWPAKLRSKPADNPVVQTLAVLPFKTLTNSEEDNALGLGMADALITRLGNLHQITVRPINSVLKYSGTDQNSSEIGQSLGVDAVLTGFVQKDGKNIRISTQMTRVSDGMTLWTDKFDDFFTNVFAVQDSISEKIVSTLSLRLTGAQKQQLTQRYTENTEAYQLFLQGRYYHNKLIPKKALEFYEAAIAIDPDYPLPYAALEGIYLGMANSGINRQEYIDKAKASVSKALALAPNLSEVHEALGDLRFAVDWDFTGAEQAYKKALELNLGNPSARYSYAVLLSRAGRHEEAIRQMEMARRIDPVSAYIYAEYADILVNARQYDAAIEQVKKARELDSGMMVTHYYLARAYAAKSMYAEVITDLQNLSKVRGAQRVQLYMAYAYARSGKRAEAEKIIEQSLQDPVENKFAWAPVIMAMAYAAMNEKDQAFQMLEKAFKNRAVNLLSLNVVPELDNLHSDPRFADLIKRIGLPE